MADDCCSRSDDCCSPPLLEGPEGQAAKSPVVCLGARDSCCPDGVPIFDGLNPRYKLMLWTVIALNVLMFITEMIAGQLAGSQALKADALDFLADTVTYGLSLAVIGASIRTRSMAAMGKGLSLTVMAAWVLASTAYQVLVLDLPHAEIMGGIGVLALAVNAASVLLLMPYKDGDANVRSVWLCSRNDAIGNVIVMIAAVAVWGTATAWPDLFVAAIMSGLFFASAVQILQKARAEYRDGTIKTTRVKTVAE